MVFRKQRYTRVWLLRVGNYTGERCLKFARKLQQGGRDLCNNGSRTQNLKQGMQSNQSCLIYAPTQLLLLHQHKLLSTFETDSYHNTNTRTRTSSANIMHSITALPLTLAALLLQQTTAMPTFVEDMTNRLGLHSRAEFKILAPIVVGIYVCTEPDWKGTCVDLKNGPGICSKCYHII